MLKISENNGTEEIGSVTPTPGLFQVVAQWRSRDRLNTSHGD